MKAARTIVAAAASGLAVAGLGLLLVLAAFTLLDGLLRATLNMPIDLVREIGDMIAAIAGACCLPIALLQRNNIVLRLFERILPPSGVRVIDTLAALLVEIVMIAMAWQFLLFSLKTMRAGDVTWLLNWPKAPFWFAVDAILWAAVAVQAFVLAEEMTGRRPASEPEGVA
ncbi:TRAP transporter small permease subunit [Bradyrhizobium jicamae]|uniref:TRAP transporter small permease subunit n=1 Tax=Bradyrhizobium jicamae TaxID=280332 RepID=UPI001BA6804B|nr:TRAP transporter small permease subunit [Bradyrhizobium jicamae]MBR0751851.1 TRAP transporter small permease subunit [Bradyrhizobium jicamae]